MAFQFSREDYERRTAWYTQARFGMFIHWGLYAIPARGEWVRSEERIPKEAYDPYIDEFNPQHCDIRAWMQAAKAAGKIAHLGLTAHSLEVFQRGLELDWVETIMFPYNIVENQGTELMEQAAAKGVGFIDMKPLAGGAIEDAALALRFVLSNPHVSIVIPGMYEPREVSQNAAAAGDSSPLSDEELGKMEQIRQELGTNFCRRCNYCAPCTVGINIPSAFLFNNYLQHYEGLADWARGRYGALAAKAGDCVACGACEERCPYQLPIREMLKGAAKDFGG